MNTRQNRINCYRPFFVIIILLSMLFIAPRSGQAAPPGQGTGGILVDGAFLQLQATPGMVYVHKMNIGAGEQSPSMDVTIQAMGFGQTLEGEFQAIPPNQDTSPFSALSFITAISKSSFHLNPGDKVPVDVTITVPADLGTNTRYATIYVKGTPANVGSVTQVLAVIVPVVITPEKARIEKTGSITDVKVDPIEPGRPIVVTTTVKNTGNRHYKIQGDVKITDPSGQLAADLPLPLSGNSIIPGYSREMVASYSALDKANGLAPGAYTATVQVLMDDGTQLGSKEVKFNISKAYRPFPEIDDEHIQITCYNDEEPGPIDAHLKTDAEITFEGTGKITGCIAIGKYNQEPAGTPHFSDSQDNGGIGTQAVKYIGVQTQGFKQGIMHLALRYSSNELNGINPNSLFLGIRSSNEWQKLSNLSVQTGASQVLGDISVTDLANGPLIALGTGDAGQSSALGSISLTSALIAGMLVLLILVIILILWQVKQRSQRPHPTPSEMRAVR